MRIFATKDTVELRNKFRAMRDKWLQISDSYMLPDRGLTEAEYDALIIYRQALRDAPSPVIPCTSWNLPPPPLFFNETVD